MSLKYTYLEFKTKINSIYNNTISVDDFIYINNHTKGICKCNICGLIWETIPKVLFKGFKCPRCSAKKKSLMTRWTKEYFVERAKEIHMNDYDYNASNYINIRTKVEILCNKCNNYFKQIPIYHLGGHGCPLCKSSRLERKIHNSLILNNINFDEQKKFDWLKRQSLDFYLTDYNIAIECQGKQHFGFGGWSKKYDFNKQHSLDINKKQLCEENNIKLVYFLDEKYNSFMIDEVYFNEIDDLIKYVNRIK